MSGQGGTCRQYLAAVSRVSQDLLLLLRCTRSKVQVMAYLCSTVQYLVTLSTTAGVTSTTSWPLPPPSHPVSISRTEGIKFRHVYTVYTVTLLDNT